jgi:hypothetical protein
MEKNKLLCKNQLGFRSGIDTENAQFNTVEFIYNDLDNSRKDLVVFLDLAKAIDTVNHQIFLQILPSLGIDKISLLWFKSYLLHRRQMVRIDNVLSHESINKYSVPQGSVSGTILFLLYINLISGLY